MHIERIFFQQNFRTHPGVDPFLFATYGIGIFINAGENVDDANKEAERLVNEYIQNKTQYPDHEHIETHSLPPEPMVLPSIQVQRERVQEQATINEHVKEIEQITDLKELKSWEALSKSYPDIKKAYEMKWMILKADSLLPNNKTIKNDKRDAKKRN